MTTAATPVLPGFGENRFLQSLSLLFLFVWIASGLRPEMVVDWWLENLLVFAFIGLLAATHRWLRLSDLSYLLIFAFLCLHELGAHYKYADVPPGEWMKTVLHSSRNSYDRVVHFSFGLLFAYPFRELLMRTAGVRGWWSYFLPADMCLALGAAYEIVEAIVAAHVSPNAADAFLGMQGDPWDTQEDMAMALIGAVIAMLVNAWMDRAAPKSRSAVAR